MTDEIVGNPTNLREQHKDEMQSIWLAAAISFIANSNILQFNSTLDIGKNQKELEIKRMAAYCFNAVVKDGPVKYARGPDVPAETLPYDENYFIVPKNLTGNT